MSFKITIEQTTVETRIRSPKWEKIGEREVLRDQTYLSQNDSKTRIESVMGHTPEIEVREIVTIKTYEQTVDSLDLVKVIAAVNGIRELNP